jgi:hypothetical protein
LRKRNVRKVVSNGVSTRLISRHREFMRMRIIVLNQ